MAAVVSVGPTMVLKRYTGIAGAPRYVVPALPALALSGGAALVLTARALVRVLRVPPAHERALRLVLGAGCVALILQARGAPSSAWSLKDVQAVAPALYARAPTHRSLRTRLATRSRSVLAALAVFQPRAPVAPERPSDDLVLFRQDKQRPVPPVPWVAEVDLGDSRALIAAVRPFLDRAQIQACYAPLAGPAEAGACVDAGFAEAGGADGPETAQEQGYPISTPAREAFPPEVLASLAGVHETFVATIAPRDGPSRRIIILAEDPRWQIEAVNGVACSGSLPARQVTIDGRAGWGTLVLGRRTPRGATPPDRYWPPATVEIDEADGALIEAIERGEIE
jgi:hypothetical protein